MKRSTARELLMQMLFEMEAQGDFSDRKRDSYVENYITDRSQMSYFNRLFQTVREHLTDIDAQIESCSEHWTTLRMARVDLSILRLATGEILYMDDIPDSAAANEAVDLAKKFGSEKSWKFVNGILGRVIRQKNEAAGGL